MKAKRRVEIFSAGCVTCEESIRQIREAACASCEVEVLDIREEAIAMRARRLGIRSLPAVVINGTVADCCVGRGPDLSALRTAGLGQL